MGRFARVVLGLLIGTCALAASFGAAAGMTANSSAFGAGTAAIDRCDTDGVTVTATISGSDVTAITVADIASACGLSSLDVTISNGTVSGTGSLLVPVGGGTVSTPITPFVPASTALRIELLAQAS